MFVLVLLVIWLPLAGVIRLLITDANTVSILAMALLFGEFLGLVQLWGRKVYRHPSLLKKYGFTLSRKNGLEFLQGLGFGLLSLLCLFGFQSLLGWVVWQPAQEFFRFTLEGLLVAVGVGLAEELVFRGWLLDELQRDYRLTTSLWSSSIIFALLHFLKPLGEVWRTAPQFVGLVLLGLILVWAKRSHRGRLGFPIGFHAGLVWSYYIVNVGQMVRYTRQVPTWVTGIDQNPLAGLVGLAFLGGVAWIMWWRSRSASQSP